MTQEIPFWKKANLTIEEATKYFNIGEHKLRELCEDEKCRFVLYVGNKKLIKKKMFEDWLETQYSI